MTLIDPISTSVALSVEAREGKTNSQERGGEVQKNVFVMYRFLRSHVAVSNGCMCERALCLQTRFLGLANQMD